MAEPDGPHGMTGPRRTEREKMVAGLPYEARDPELVEARAQARRLARAFAQTDPGDFAGQHALLARLFARVGAHTVVEAPFHIDYGWNVSLGDGVYVNAFCVLLDCAPITVGDRSQIGPGAKLCAATHSTDPEERRRDLEYALPVTIG